MDALNSRVVETQDSEQSGLDGGSLHLFTRRSYFRREPPETSFYQKTDGRAYLLCPGSLLSASPATETRGKLTGAVNSRRILRTIIFLWAPYTPTLISRI